MATITIPNHITRGEELVVIPRKEFIPTAAQRKDLERARAEYKQGKYLTLRA